MNSTDYSVKIHCPIANAEETVFFGLVENGEGVTLYKDRFNGCNHNYSACPECAACKDAAFELVKKHLNR